ncbi:MAG TPA: hypothetical protein VGO47_13730 [Chlamydiales bacterium]|nr:hypothetical protein [Chlamydiales bacterium]
MLQEDDEEEEKNVDPNKPRPPRPPRTRGRGMVRRGRGARSNLAQRMIIAPGSPDSEIIGEFDETETGGSHQLPEFNPDEEEESRVVEERHPVEDKEMLKTGRPASMEWILLSPTFYTIRQSLPWITRFKPSA